MAEGRFRPGCEDLTTARRCVEKRRCWQRKEPPLYFPRIRGKRTKNPDGLRRLNHGSAGWKKKIPAKKRTPLCISPVNGGKGRRFRPGCERLIPRSRPKPRTRWKKEDTGKEKNPHCISPVYGGKGRRFRMGCGAV